MTESPEPGNEIIPLNEETRIAVPRNFDEDASAVALPGNPGREVVPANFMSQGEQNQVNVPEPADVVIAGGSFEGATIGPQMNKKTLKVNDYKNAKILHFHHHYGRDREKASQEPATASSLQITNGKKNGDSPPDEGCSKITDDIYMYSTKPLRKGTKIFKGYQLHASGYRRQLALKVIFPCESTHIREVQHLLKLSYHQNVVQIIQSKEHQGKARELYIAMELCSSCNLHDYFKQNCEENIPFDIPRTMTYAKQLVAGVEHIHHNKIIHRDLKPENVLFSLDGRQLKVTDFGISKELRGRPVTKLTSPGQGTDGFRAPETYNSDVISQKSDIFSLGLTLHGLFSNGKHPFGDDPDLLNYNIKKNKGRDLSGLLITGRRKELFILLLTSMLEFNPEKRPTIEEVSRHRFFSLELTAVETASAQHPMNPEPQHLQEQQGSSHPTAGRAFSAPSETIPKEVPSILSTSTHPEPAVSLRQPTSTMNPAGVSSIALTTHRCATSSLSSHDTQPVEQSDPETTDTSDDEESLLCNVSTPQLPPGIIRKSFERNSRASTLASLPDRVESSAQLSDDASGAMDDLTQ